MPKYRVTWSIDIDAPDAYTAAQEAVEIMRKIDTTDRGDATLFEVQPWRNGMAPEYLDPAETIDVAYPREANDA